MTGDWSPNWISLPAAAVYLISGEIDRARKVDEMSRLLASKELALAENAWPELRQAILSRRLIVRGSSLIWPHDDTTPSSTLSEEVIPAERFAGATLTFHAPTMNGVYAIMAKCQHPSISGTLYWTSVRLRADGVLGKTRTVTTRTAPKGRKQ